MTATRSSKQNAAAERENIKRNYARELHERNARLVQAAHALTKVLDNITRSKT